jgi:hypothetical protein
MIVSLESLWQYENCQVFQGDVMVKPTNIDALNLRYHIRSPLTGRVLRLSR